MSRLPVSLVLSALRPCRTRIAAGPSRLPRHLPAVAAAVALRPAVRTLLTRRLTSFWAPSYPHNPAAPLLPGPSAAGSVVTQEDAAATRDGRRRQRKERYLDSLMHKAGELGLKCSILDADGNWTAEEGTYRTMDLCRAHDLDPRDLRKLDSLNPSLVPIILTRRSCILLSILNIRALIKPDRVIIFSAPGTEDSETMKRFKAHLQANVRAGLSHAANVRAAGEGDRQATEEDLGLSYEHRALESILVITANGLEEEMAFVRRLVRDLLDSFEHDINRDNLRKLLHYSRRLAGFQSRAKYIKSTVDEVLDSDEDLSAMYLSDKLQGKPRALHDHEQLELLLESFTKQVEEIVSEIDTMVLNVQSTQEVAELMLDSGRNALLALDIKVSMATFGIGAGALVAGIFGMNLTHGLEENPHAFSIVSGSAALFAFLVYLYSIRILRKVRHVALVGRPSSVNESVREAKERFVRERAEYARACAEAEASECAPGASPAVNTIPDYETRWQHVRRALKSRTSFWDRIFHPNSMRRSLLGLRTQQSKPGEMGRIARPAVLAATPTTPPTQSPSRPHTPRVESPPLARPHIDSSSSSSSNPSSEN